MREDNDDARRHLLLRLRIGTSPSPLAATVAATPYLIASTLILGFVIVGLFLRPPTPPTLNVTPLTLDFGKLELGKKAVKSVVIETSSVSNLTWKNVAGNPKWLNVAQSNVIKESDNLSEVVYDVTANTGNLHEGKYSVTYDVDVGGVKDQQVQIHIQVIPLSIKPLPARLNVDPLTLDFGTQNAGSQVTKLLTVSNSGQMDLKWIVDKGNATWLTLDMVQGKILPGGLPQVIKVMVSTAHLTASPYSTRITFTSNGGNVSVDVKLSVVVRPTPNGPQVLGVIPSSGLNDGGTTVVLTGTGFTNASLVSFGLAQVPARGFTVNSDTQITIVSPPANKINFNSTVDVTVTTPIGTSSTNPADHFTYHAPAIPTVTKISPQCGSMVGGTSVMIIGTGFTGATAVSFGGISIANINFKVNSDTQIMAVSPAGSGSVDVTVTTPGGTSLPNPGDKFTYLPKPVVFSIDPLTGPSGGGTIVTITGLNFTCITGVSFGGKAATNVTFISDSQITADSPAGSGIVDVTVTTPGGTSDTNLDDLFTYIPPQVTVKIMSPNKNSSFPSSKSDFSHTDPITFTAMASDPSGHPLTGTALQWSVDGNSLGTGESFSATLPSGCGPISHIVKVVATDSASGLNASDAITVNTGQTCLYVGRFLR
jgi:hypothetical protein